MTRARDIFASRARKLHSKYLQKLDKSTTIDFVSQQMSGWQHSLHAQSMQIFEWIDRMHVGWVTVDGNNVTINTRVRKIRHTKGIAFFVVNSSVSLLIECEVHEYFCDSMKMSFYVDKANSCIILAQLRTSTSALEQWTVTSDVCFADFFASTLKCMQSQFDQKIDNLIRQRDMISKILKSKDIYEGDVA